MFYEPGKTAHGLSKNPFNSLVIPRPIGWISSIDKDGIVNLAPYSFFNAVSYRPPIVMFQEAAEQTRWPTHTRIPSGILRKLENLYAI